MKLEEIEWIKVEMQDGNSRWIDSSRIVMVGYNNKNKNLQLYLSNGEYLDIKYDDKLYKLVNR